MPSTQTTPMFEQLDKWLVDLQEVKQAAAPKPKGQVKKAGPSGMGKTTHPSADVEDNLHNAPEGSRYRENESDIKKDVPASVDATGPIKGDEDKVMPNIGTQQAATGEDPKVEDDYKPDKDDPGTTHPCNADDVGEKYSSVNLNRLLKLSEAKANSLLADIGNGFFNSQATAPTQQLRKAASAPAQGTPQNVLSGYNAAANAGVQEASLTPQDMQKMAASVIEHIQRDASFDADLVGQYLTNYQQKLAAPGSPEEEPVPEGPPPGEPGPEGAEGGPPLGDAAGGGGLGGGAPPMMPPPPGAGAPPGGPPMGAGGPGGPGGDPMAALQAGVGDQAPSDDAKMKAMQDLLMAMEELGIDPRELAAMAEQNGGDTEAAPKLASAAITFKRSGKFRFSETKTAKERADRDQIKSYVREVAGIK